MGCKIKVSKKGLRVFRLFWNQMTSWEGTALKDTPENRKIMAAQGVLIAKEIKEGKVEDAGNGKTP